MVSNLDRFIVYRLQCKLLHAVVVLRRVYGERACAIN